MVAKQNCQRAEKRVIGKASVVIDRQNHKLVDISRNGVCFSSPDDYASLLGEDRLVIVSFPEDQEFPIGVEVHLSAKICHNHWDHDRQCYLVGLHVEQIADRHQQVLNRLVRFLNNTNSFWGLDFKA